MKAILALTVATALTTMMFGYLNTQEEAAPQLSQADDRVLIELYSESLCPYCVTF